MHRILLQWEYPFEVALADDLLFQVLYYLHLIFGQRTAGIIRYGLHLSITLHHGLRRAEDAQVTVPFKA